MKAWAQVVVWCVPGAWGGRESTLNNSGSCRGKGWVTCMGDGSDPAPARCFVTWKDINL